MTSPKLVILGRDGTINEERENYVKSADDWVPLSGALEAIARLNQAGWHTVVATNQPGLGGGLFDMAALNEVHLKMNVMLQRYGGRIEAVFLCPHLPDDRCDCRKPKPGMFLQIGDRYGADLAQVHAVGNSMADVLAGKAAGCMTHLVRTGQGAWLDGAAVARIVGTVPGTEIHADLPAFVEALLQHERAIHGHAGEGNTGYGTLE